jgi:hypothetical protein
LQADFVLKTGPYRRKYNVLNIHLCSSAPWRYALGELVLLARAFSFKLHLEPADAIFLVGGLDRTFAGLAHDLDGFPGGPAQRYQDRGSDHAATAEAPAAVDHHGFASFETLYYVLDQGSIVVRFRVRRNPVVGDRQVEHFYALFLSLLEEPGYPEVRMLGALHQGDECLRVVFLPEPQKVGLEIPLPSTVGFVCFLARGEGYPEPTGQLERLRGQEIYPNGVRFGGLCLVVAYRSLFS